MPVPHALDDRVLPSLLVVLAALAWCRAAPAQNEVQKVPGPVDFTALGAAITPVGDVDGDGCDDVAAGGLGSAVFGGTQGRAGVFSGRTGAPLWTVTGPHPYAQLGAGVAACGDVDGDGHADVAVGAPGDDGYVPDGGSVRVYSALDGTPLLAFGGAAGEFYGDALDGLGDVDGDGVPDLVVGSATHDEGPDTLVGVVRVHSGADASVLLEVVGDVPGARLGTSVAGIGDHDGDGVPDILAGARGAEGALGRALVLSGADGTTLLTFVGVAPNDQFGSEVAAAGDVDGDGTTDLIVSAPLDDQHAANGGRVALFSGRTGALLHEWFGDQDGAQLGSAVAGPGDVDLDGTPDVLFGAVAWTIAGQTPLHGRATLASGADGSLLLDLYGTIGVHSFATAVAGAGDVNADGRPDVAIGHPYGGGLAQQPGVVLVETWRCGSLFVYGAGSPGGSGVPELAISGCASAGGTLTLLLSHVPVTVNGLLVIGLVPASLPLKGCTLLVQPLLIMLPYTVIPGFGGTVKLQGPLPMGLPPGSSFVLQAFNADPGAPAGLSSSNGVQLVTF